MIIGHRNYRSYDEVMIKYIWRGGPPSRLTNRPTWQVPGCQAAQSAHVLVCLLIILFLVAMSSILTCHCFSQLRLLMI